MRCDNHLVNKAHVAAAARILRTVVAMIESRELTAPKRIIPRLEGAAAALEAVAGARPRKLLARGDERGDRV